MNHFASADVDAYVMDRGVEEHEITDAQVAFGYVTSYTGLGLRSARQLDADLAVNTFRERRAVEIAGRARRCPEFIRRSQIAFGSGNDCRRFGCSAGHLNGSGRQYSRASERDGESNRDSCKGTFKPLLTDHAVSSILSLYRYWVRFSDRYLTITQIKQPIFIH